jgi:hypothetical protein
VAVVRPAVERRLAQLRRQGVVAEVREHSPGSFAVVLAPMRALFAAPRRTRHAAAAPRPDPAGLRALAPETRAVLRELATVSLHSLGAPHTEALLANELAHVFGKLAKAVGPGANREARLHEAAVAALEDARDAG